MNYTSIFLEDMVAKLAATGAAPTSVDTGVRATVDGFDTFGECASDTTTHHHPPRTQPPTPPPAFTTRHPPPATQREEGLPTEWAQLDGEGAEIAPKGAFSWSELAGEGGPRTPPLRGRSVLHEGLVEDTLPRFLQARPSRPLAWLNADLDLYGGTIAALKALGPRVVRGTRLHFHELQSEPHTHTPAIPGQNGGHLGGVVHEVRALRDFLIAFPCVRLKLEDVAPNGAYDASAAFVVTQGAFDCEPPPR